MTDHLSAQNPEHLTKEALRLLEKQGATSAEVIFLENTSLSVDVRHSKIEGFERSEAHHIGLRAFVGARQAMVSSSDLSTESLETLAERVIQMAKIAPEDPFCGQAPVDRLINPDAIPNLDLLDTAEPSVTELEELSQIAESTGLAVQGITNSEGAGASWSKGRKFLATTHGFSAGYARSSYSLYCTLIAGTDLGMERDYDYVTARHFSDLGDPTVIGQTAAERTLARLNPSKVPSGVYPVIFDKRIASSLLGDFIDAIAGSSIARQVSFLKDSLGELVFNPNIQIIDDPLRVRGLGSVPFDGEGVACQSLNIVENGVLKQWLLDSTTARQLKLETNGRAVRGSTRTPPSTGVTNFYLQAGQDSVDQLCQEIGNGLYITEVIGDGANPVTGDYSIGAAGFLIENGKPTKPVSEITIAGTLQKMFSAFKPANDLKFNKSVVSPSVYVGEMTVAGS